MAPAFESSGIACNSYQLFRSDREAMERIHANAYRFSTEWSRIEPMPGKFSAEAIQHYADVLDDLLANGIEPVVTLHHFTNPQWFEEAGGWENPRSVTWYENYVRHVVPLLNGRVNYWLTFNEPNVMVQHKYIAGLWHPYKKSMIRPYRNVYPHLIEAHKRAYTIIKEHNPDAQVSITSNYALLQPKKNHLLPINYYYYFMYQRFSNDYMYRNLRDSLDFLGLNFYTRAQFTLSPLAPFFGKPHITIDPKPPDGPDDLTFDARPQDISPVVERLVQRYKKPVLITENGFVTNDDEKRAMYIAGIQAELVKLRAAGWPLWGYLHWSLLDNHEWNMGKSARFGLYSVDPQTFERKPKPSASIFADAALEHKKISQSFQNR